MGLVDCVAQAEYTAQMQCFLVVQVAQLVGLEPTFRVGISDC